MTIKELNLTAPIASATINSERSLLRTCAVLSVLGVLLFLAGTFTHPGQADPANSPAAFAEYAADDTWIASHLFQFFGGLFVFGGLVALYYSMTGEKGIGLALARLGFAGAVAVIAVVALLQAVDGIALKEMVDQWASAPAERKDAAFMAAEAVRWIEVGINSLFRLLVGMTMLLFGAAIVAGRSYPRWLGGIGLAAGVVWFLSGLYVGYNGVAITPAGAVVGLLSFALLIVWSLSLAVLTWSRAGRSSVAAN